jgi:hypothetical protein
MRPSTYVEVLDDDCRCRWVNRSDNGGWELRTWNKGCPKHPETLPDENR